jgi:hypothetical protein
MMSDLFWDVATSYAVLGVLAALAIAAFAVAHIPALAERLFPALIPYTKAAALVQVLAAALLMFLVGFRIADERAETKQLKIELAWKQEQLAQQEATARDAERLKQEAEQAAQEAKGKLDEFRTRYGDKPEAVCAFTPDDLERLRNLGRPQR